MKNLIFLALIPVVFGIQEPRNIFDTLSDRLKPVSPVVYIKKVDDRDRDHDRDRNSYRQDDFCERRNGAITVGEHCYQYVENKLSWIAASSFCSSSGGTLWVPEIEDPYLYATLFRKFPQLFAAAAHDVFIGISRVGARYNSLRGKDYSRNPLILNGQNMDRNCFSLHFDFGALYIGGIQNCGITLGDFVCQFDRHHSNRL